MKENYNIIPENTSEKSDNEDSKDSIEKNKQEKDVDKETQKYLNNLQLFTRKNYSKIRNTTIVQENSIFNRKTLSLNKPEVKKRYSKYGFKHEDFGLIKIKSKIEFFEKKLIDKRKTTIAYNPQLSKIKNYNYHSLNQQIFSFDSNKKLEIVEKKKSEKKLNLNLTIDYSKILNSSKINQKEKELDLFITENKIINQKSKNEKDEKNESDELSDSLNFSKEISTNISHGNVMEQPVSKINKQKSEICYYKDLIEKIYDINKNQNPLSNDKDNSNSCRFKGTISDKNYKYMLVKKNNNKISLEKTNILKNGIKKIYSENIADNMTLKKLENAKFRLNQANSYKKIKRQILDILDNIIVQNNIKNKGNINNEKINNIYDKTKLIRAFEILPILLLINQKLNIILQNSDNSSSISYKGNFNEKAIKQSVSSIYFLECIGLESIILFNGNLKNKKLINDINQNFQLVDINDKKKYIKYYFKNVNKANLFLKVLINIINNIRETVNIK